RYTFENSASDISGNGHNGVLVNGVSFNSKSKEGSKSIKLDGINDYVNLGTLNLGNQFSFATWVYIPSGNSNIQTLAANTSSGSTRNGFKIFVNSYGTSDRRIIVETGNGSLSGLIRTPALTFSVNNWNHIAVVLDRTNKIGNIYLNGKNVTSESSILTDFSTNSPVWLGMMTNIAYPMLGYLDDTRFYDRALSAAEVSALTTLPGLKAASIAFIQETTPQSMEAAQPIAYPNPFRNEFEINSDLLIKDIQIFNLTGTKVYEKNNILSDHIIVNDLIATGQLFIVKITLEDNSTHVVKLSRSAY
ncbi:MAG TPA: LamG-like jellyroll fold domain-containing protein, partial [Bacteroidales bacterium]|nr:LamG-like jellyroll fold domain-containing protein [Bacteroidales bacterium]